MEEMRTPIVDSVVLTVINKQILQPHHFEATMGVYQLTAAGRKLFLQQFEQRLNTEIQHPVFQYKATYRRCLELQARLLAKYPVGRDHRLHAHSRCVEHSRRWWSTMAGQSCDDTVRGSVRHCRGQAAHQGAQDAQRVRPVDAVQSVRMLLDRKGLSAVAAAARPPSGSEPGFGALLCTLRGLSGAGRDGRQSAPGGAGAFLGVTAVRGSQRAAAVQAATLARAKDLGPVAGRRQFLARYRSARLTAGMTLATSAAGCECLGIYKWRKLCQTGTSQVVLAGGRIMLRKRPVCKDNGLDWPAQITCAVGQGRHKMPEI